MLPFIFIYISNFIPFQIISAARSAGLRLQSTESFIAGSFLVSEVLFSDKWRPFLLVSKPDFSPQSLCPRANVW